MSNKIEAYSNYRKIDRGGETMPKSWQWPSNDSCELEDTDSRKTQIRHRLSQTQAVVCVLTQCIEDTDIISYLHELAQKGHRVYLLLGKYSPKLGQLRGHCLIRILPADVLPHGSLILSDPGSHSAECLLLSSSLGEQNQVELLCTSDKQETIKELFRYFCYLFWERANTEYLSESDDTTGRDIVDKGVDVYFDTEKLHPHYLYDKFLINCEGLSRRKLLGQYISHAPGMQHLRIEASGERKLDDITFSQLPTREEFTKISPDSFPDELGYLETSYHWLVLPYYLPQGAELSPYYKGWEEFSTITADALNRLIGEIDRKLNTPQPNMGAEYARLYLNFKLSIEDIREELDSLKSFPWGYDPATGSKQQALKALKAQYQTACKKFDDDLKRLDLEQRLAQNKTKIENLKRRQESLLETTNFNTQDQEEQKNGKSDEYQRNIKEVEKAIEDAEKEELQLKRELSESKDQANTTSEESSLEQLYNKGKNRENKNTPTNTSDSSLPILPSIGRLFQVKQKLFLAIDKWDEYDEGLKETVRLGAELCVNNNEYK